jgi:hypothetical protein
MALLVVGSGSLAATPAVAQEPLAKDDATAPTAIGAAISSADAGMLLPLTVSPRTASQRGVVRVIGGYDSPRERMQFEAIADVTIIGPVAIRAGAMYGQQRDTFRPPSACACKPCRRNVRASC